MKRYFTLLAFSFLATASCVNAGFDIDSVLKGDPYDALGALRAKKTVLKEKRSEQKELLAENADLSNGYAQKLTAIRLAQEALRVVISTSNPKEVDVKMQLKSAIWHYNDAKKLIKEGKELQTILHASREDFKKETPGNGKEIKNRKIQKGIDQDFGRAALFYRKPNTRKFYWDPKEENIVLSLLGARVVRVEDYGEEAPGKGKEKEKEKEKETGKTTKKVDWTSYPAPVLDWNEHILGGMFAGETSFEDQKGRSWLYINADKIGFDMQGFSEKEPEITIINRIAKKIQVKYDDNEKEIKPYFTKFAKELSGYVGKYGFCYTITGIPTPLFLVQED